MVKATEKKTVEITLTLTAEEANWLKGLMQNPLYGLSPKQEAEADKKIRMSFWNALGGDTPVARPNFKRGETGVLL